MYMYTCVPSSFDGQLTFKSVLYPAWLLPDLYHVCMFAHAGLSMLVSTTFGSTTPRPCRCTMPRLHHHF